MIIQERIERALEQHIILLRRINHTLGRSEQRAAEIETLAALLKDLGTVRIRRRTRPRPKALLEKLAKVVEKGLEIRPPKVSEHAFPPIPK